MAWWDDIVDYGATADDPYYVHADDPAFDPYAALAAESETD